MKASLRARLINDTEFHRGDTEDHGVFARRLAGYCYKGAESQKISPQRALRNLLFDNQDFKEPNPFSVIQVFFKVTEGKAGAFL